jgi:hypothetical protein
VQGKGKKEGRPAGRAEQRKRPARAWLGPKWYPARRHEREKNKHKTESMKEITDENFELSRVEREQKQSN